ncbi:TadE/TadG family type IV pilus assembly protein [Aquicoccus sp. G2-2]|uniref:TadE/TadG family type IV pilus assembly protein n=1 Tax=Aquicoccus sp. G2-2 TaxID=3092120 RepID=UPI002AE03404|nr:pilus assembly protein [Aquicoccus sp. G2-2]MEA1113851.1 pilus assembly protein [Aquicoccus sp. G2-2]
MFASLKFRLKLAYIAFRDDVRGTVAVEAAIIFPMLMWAFLSMFVFFEGFRQSSINDKAANTIADMLSRETENITPTYINNTKELFDLLAEADADSKIRISVIKWVKKKDEYKIVWSKAKGAGLSKLQTEDVKDWTTKLPTVPNQERIVLVETWSTYEPLFNVGLDPVVLKSFVFTRLRFAPQLRFSST